MVKCSTKYSEESLNWEHIIIYIDYKRIPSLFFIIISNHILHCTMRGTKKACINTPRWQISKFVYLQNKTAFCLLFFYITSITIFFRLILFLVHEQYQGVFIDRDFKELLKATLDKGFCQMLLM